jgi:hypothetical protein
LATAPGMAAEVITKEICTFSHWFAVQVDGAYLLIKEAIKQVQQLTSTKQRIKNNI